MTRRETKPQSRFAMKEEEAARDDIKNRIKEKLMNMLPPNKE